MQHCGVYSCLKKLCWDHRSLILSASSDSLHRLCKGRSLLFVAPEELAEAMQPLFLLPVLWLPVGHSGPVIVVFWLCRWSGSCNKIISHACKLTQFRVHDTFLALPLNDAPLNLIFGFLTIIATREATAMQKKRKNETCRKRCSTVQFSSFSASLRYIPKTG